jgi:hypothetical protein
LLQIGIYYLGIASKDKNKLVLPQIAIQVSTKEKLIENPSLHQENSKIKTK